MRTALSHRLVGLFAGLAAGVSCSAPSSPGRGPLEGTEEYQSSVREPFTTHWEIHVDGSHVGYLLAYEFSEDDLQLSAIDHHLAHHDLRPGNAFTAEDLRDYEVFDRSLPAGTYRILDLEFRGLGTVKPNGEVLRHGSSGADSLGVHSLERGLRRFYGDPADLQLILLRDAIHREAEDEEIS